MNDKPTARQRSAFGAFQLKGSHLKTGGSPVLPKASAADMAYLLRDGKTLPEVAEEFSLSVSTIRHRLNDAGYTSHGVPKGK